MNREQQTSRSISLFYTERLSSIKEQSQQQLSPRVVLKKLKSEKLHIENHHLPSIRANSLIRRTSQNKVVLLQNDTERLTYQKFKTLSNCDARLSLVEYIRQNCYRQTQNQIKLPEYEKSAPFLIQNYNYVDKVLPRYGIAKYNLKEEAVDGSKLILEKIMLQRLMK